MIRIDIIIYLFNVNLLVVIFFQQQLVIVIFSNNAVNNSTIYSMSWLDMHIYYIYVGPCNMDIWLTWFCYKFLRHKFWRYSVSPFFRFDSKILFLGLSFTVWIEGLSDMSLVGMCINWDQIQCFMRMVKGTGSYFWW